ncbi:hypothetical protein [Halobacterium wangiae]|uniref:hypothetical protein n=1 Tax=Halobacterium wangiae TaxID=2902623 RepID=UPI001E2EEFDB|nr:hypothetical protein [Halobacterium wangiae]
MRRVPLAVVVLLLAAASVAGTPAADPSAEVVARYPSDGEMVEEPVVTPSDVERAGAPERGETGWQVPVTLTDSGAASFTDTLVDAGFTDEGVQSCRADAERNDQGYCLLTVVDGEVVSAYSLGAGLADAIESGSFEANPQFVFVTQNETTAERAARAFGWTPPETTRTSETPESTETTVESGETTTDLADSDTSAADVPGFGLLVALLAVAVGTVVSRRH